MKILSILFLLIFFSCKAPVKHSFDSELNTLFFGANINDTYEDVLAYYKHLDLLAETEPLGWTTYPPLSALRQSEQKIISQSFKFDHHPGL